MAIFYSRFSKDEATLEDDLNHAKHVAQVAKMIDERESPHVIGIHGDWGTGKTSFLRKLRLCMAGKESGYADAEHEARKLWGDQYKNIVEHKYETIWFEAWHYQFEANPIVALLNEIRAHFTWTRKLLDESNKLTFAALMSIDSLTKQIGFQPTKIVEGGEKWERDQMTQPLPSEMCRQLLEQSIKTILQKDKRLVVFVDDLDRCQAQVAFRFLEAIKIYLSIPSCIFVLGLDLRSIRQAVSSELKRTTASAGPSETSASQEEIHPSDIYAADYLSKIFQSFYHLPLVTQPEQYLKSLLTSQTYHEKIDEWVKVIVEFGLLPANPRKIKSFVNGLTLYVSQLNSRLQDQNKDLDIKLALILAWLNLMTHDIYRILESNPDFWVKMVEFCKSGKSEHSVFSGRSLSESATAPSDQETGYIYSPAFRDPADERVFRVARLIREWRNGAPPITDEFRDYFLR